MKIFSVLSAILLAGMHHAAVPQWSVYGPRNVMMAQQTAENITQIAFNPKLAAPGEYWCGARLAFKSPIKEKVMTFSVKGSVIRRLNFKVTSSNKRVVNRQVMVFQEWEEVKLDLTDMINDISTIDIIFMGAWPAVTFDIRDLKFSARGELPLTEGKDNKPYGYAVSTTPAPRFTFAEPNCEWLKRYDAKRKQIAAAKNMIDIVFLGDSITHSWDNPQNRAVLKKYFPQYEILNLAFGGDRTEHQLWMAKESGFFAKIRPKLVVILIGTNSVGSGFAPGAVSAGISEVVKAVRQKAPHSKILLMGVFPRGQQPNHKFRSKIDEINRALLPLADNQNIFFLDIKNELLEKDGSLSKKITGDFLHLTPAGFEIWAKAMQPVINRLVPKTTN